MCSFYVADMYANCESFSSYVVQAIITQASLMYEVKYETHLLSTLPLWIIWTKPSQLAKLADLVDYVLLFIVPAIF